MKALIKFTTITLLTFCFCASPALFAADGSWKNDADGNWSESANWVDGNIPNGSSDTAFFTNTYTANRNVYPDIAGVTVGGITATDVDDSGDQKVIIKVSSNLTFASGTTVDVDDSLLELVFQSVLDGSDGFTKTGNGVATLGTTGNPLSGTINVNAGTLQIKEDNAISNASVTVASGAKLWHNRQANAKDIIVNGTFESDIAAPWTWTVDSFKFGNGMTYLNGNKQTLIANSIEIDNNLTLVTHETIFLAPSVTVKSGRTLTQDLYNNNNSSNITIESGAVYEMDRPPSPWQVYNCFTPLTIAGDGVGAQGAIVADLQTKSYFSNITLSANATIGFLNGVVNPNMYLCGPIDESGTDCDLVLSARHGGHGPLYFHIYGANTYGGSTRLYSRISSLQAKVYGNQRFPNTDFSMYGWGNIYPSCRLDLNGFDQEIKSLDLQVAGTLHENVIADLSGGTKGTLTIGGNINVGANGTFEVDAPIVTSGDLYAIGTTTVLDLKENLDLEGVLYVAYTGTGTSIVNLNNTVKVNCNRLYMGFGNAIPTVNMNSGTEIACAKVMANTGGLNGFLNIDGATLSDNTTPEINWIENLPNATIEIKSGGATFNVDNSYREVNEVITGTAGGDLTKTGSATLALNVVPTFDGDIIVSAGGFRANCDLSAITVTLAAGSGIGGSGTIGAMTVPSGATISPGNSIGTLSAAGNVTLAAGSAYDWEVDLNNADLIDVTAGSLIIGGTMTVNVIDAGSPDGTDLILAQTTGGISGDPTDITLSYGAGVGGPANPTVSGNNLVAAIIPEPGIIGLLSLLALAIIRRK